MTTDLAAPPAEVGTAADSLAKLHFRVASLFLVVGAAAGLLSAIQLSAPDFLNSGPLSYGRVYPVFTSAVLFGWATIGLIGAMYYLLPRLTGVSLVDETLARISFWLIAGGTALGIGTVLAGGNQGLPMFEFPFYVDIVLVVGYAGVTRVISRTATSHREPRVYISVWFFVAAAWWLLFSYVVGSLAWFKGADLEVANRFAENGLFLLWVIPAGLGILFYLIPKITDSALYSNKLAVVGFWAMAGSFAWVGTHSFTFGPAADWLETINVVFGIAMLVPIIAIIANVLLTADWQKAADSVSFRLALAGTAFFGLLGVQVLAQAFRASSTVVQFTSWTEATFAIAIIGAGSLWLMALIVELRGGGRVPLYLTTSGLTLLVGTLWLGGLLAGFTWSAGPRSQDFVNFGEGFVNTTAQLAGFDSARWVAWLVLATGLLVFAVRTLTARHWSFADVGEPSDAEPEPEAGVLPPGQIAFASVLVVGLAFVTTVLFPALDASDEEPSLLAVASRDYDAFADSVGTPQAAALLDELGLDPIRIAEGREVYISEGCIYCHTQQVRANVADVGLGAVTSRADVTLTAPALLGRIRLGPDLSHAGSRPLTNDVSWLTAHLSDPRAARSWSSSPSYDYLSDADLNALAQYIVSLQ